MLKCLWNASSHPRGDLYVHFQLRMPTGNGADLTAIFQKLADTQKEDPRAGIDVEPR